MVWQCASSLRVKLVKEYVRGAFQALSWAMLLLLDVKELSDLEKVLTQIDQALNKLRTLAAKDFLEDMQTEQEIT